MPKIIAISCLYCLMLCHVSTSLANESIPLIHVSGNIIEVSEVPTTKKPNADQNTQFAGQMFGLLGALIAEAMNTIERGYYVYKVKVNETGQTVDVASRSNYLFGDCVTVTYPESMGDSPDVGIETGVELKKSTDCAPK